MGKERREKFLVRIADEFGREKAQKAQVRIDRRLRRLAQMKKDTEAGNLMNQAVGAVGLQPIKIER